MNDQIGAEILKAPVYQTCVGNASLDQTEAGYRRNDFPPTGGEVVDDEKLKAPGQKIFYDVRAEAPGSSGNQYAHGIKLGFL